MMGMLEWIREDEHYYYFGMVGVVREVTVVRILLVW